MSTIAFSPSMGGEWYKIQFRYDPDLVTLIKTVIPSAFRKWDASNKEWSASKMWAQAFAQAARHAGHTTSGIPDPGAGTSGSTFGAATGAGVFTPPWTASSNQSGSPFRAGYNTTSAGFYAKKTQPPPPQPPKPPPALTENWAKELMRRTSPELREKVYRALAKVLHEDLGGDGRLMQELNDARLKGAS